jgi:pimeloyl-ACP methyl ester carboxylesterase
MPTRRFCFREVELLRSNRLLLALFFAMAALSGPMASAHTQANATPVPAEGDFAGLVAIGGRSLFLECRGSGSPTVILEDGFRTRADVWTEDLIQPDAPRTMTLPGIARFTRVCAYDRPGTATVRDGELLPSRSDVVPVPRTAEDAVADVHTLLDAAGIPRPHDLVGHSFGGLFMRLYAATYPAGVAGMVLVDAFSEVMEDAMTPEQWAAYDEIFQPVPPELADYQDLEFTELDVSLDQVQEATAASPLRPIPLIVLSRGLAMAMPADLPGGLSGEMSEAARQTAQDGLAGLLPDARHVIAEESEHYIQLQQPELVIAVVWEVVEAVRDPASWAQATPSA